MDWFVPLGREGPSHCHVFCDKQVQHLQQKQLPRLRKKLLWPEHPFPGGPAVAPLTPPPRPATGGVSARGEVRSAPLQLTTSAQYAGGVHYTPVSKKPLKPTSPRL